MFENNLDALNANWDDWIHHILESSDTVAEDNKNLVGRKVKEFYIGAKEITIGNLRSFGKV